MLSVFAAGSLRRALPAMAEACGLSLDVRFGPAGLLRREIEAGLRPDLFLSASMAHAEAVSGLGGYGSPVEFLENRLCLYGRETAARGGVLDVMLDPAVRLGTSTPGADPGGDYALAVFDRAEAVRPGSGAVLRNKALPLVGGALPGPEGKGGSPVAGLFVADRVDAFLGYRTTGLDVAAGLPGLVVRELPPELAVRAVYGAVARDDKAEATHALDRLLSAEARAVAVAFGF